MTVLVLHKNKIAHEKRVLLTYICYRKALGQLQYHLNVFQIFALDIQLMLQLSRCLSVTNISKHNMFCEILFLCNTTLILPRLVYKFKDSYVHKFKEYLYLYEQSLNKGEILDLLTVDFCLTHMCSEFTYRRKSECLSIPEK